MEVLSYDYVDFVFINEGVYSLNNLLKTDLKTNLNKIKGIGFKDENKKPILNPPSEVVPENKLNTELPGYAWDLLPKNKNTLDFYRAHYWHTFFSE